MVFTCHFLAFNCLNLILKIKQVIYQILCVVICVLFGNTLFHFDFYYFCLPQGLVAVGFCYIGYLLKKYKLFERLYNSPWTYLVLIPVSIAEYKWGCFDLCPGVFNNLFLDFIGTSC